MSAESESLAESASETKEGRFDLSVVIVTFESRSDVLGCLSSLAADLGPANTEVVVVDNGSADDTVELVREWGGKGDKPANLALRLIANRENRGYTRAMNRALEASRGDKVLFLNPDTRIQPGALQRLSAALDQHPQVGVVAPQLLNPDGSVQPSCRRFPRRRDLVYEILGLSRLFPSSPVFNHWKMVDFDHARMREVDQPQGACLMTRRQVLERSGPLDERFPMFFSDVDWCRRVKEAGWKIVFLPEAKVVHRKGASVYRTRAAMIWSSHRSFYDYWQKYAGERAFDRLLNVVLGTGLWITALIRIAALRLGPRHP